MSSLQPTTPRGEKQPGPKPEQSPAANPRKPESCPILSSPYYLSPSLRNAVRKRGRDSKNAHTKKTPRSSFCFVSFLLPHFEKIHRHSVHTPTHIGTYLIRRPRKVLSSQPVLSPQHIIFSKIVSSIVSRRIVSYAIPRQGKARQVRLSRARTSGTAVFFRSCARAAFN